MTPELTQNIIALLSAIITALLGVLLKKLSETKQAQKDAAVVVAGKIGDIKAAQQETAAVTAATHAQEFSALKEQVDRNSAILVATAQEASTAAGKAAVTTETIHSLVNSQLAAVTKERDDARKVNAEFMAMNSQLTKILSSAGIKPNGTIPPDPKVKP